MKTKTLVLVPAVVAAIATFVDPPSAHGCSCVPTPPPAQAFQVADAVLMGKVLSIKEGPSPYHVTAEIEVSKIWKGEKDFIIEILTTRDLGAMCGFYFQVGKTYLIYAYKNQDGLLETNNCTRSRSEEHAAADLVFLSSQPGVGKESACCGSKNIFAGDAYLFLGMLLYLLKRKPSV
jgi:hypothetical protein